MAFNKKSISSIQNYFRDKPVKKAYLFGSFARNEASRGSDLDILVELDYSQSIGLRFIEMQIDLEKLLKQKVDLVSANAISKYIKPYVDQEKILIYEK